MTDAASPQGLREDLLAMARDALLDQVNRGDTRHALRELVSRLSRRWGAPCSLAVVGAQGALRWHCGPQGDLPGLVQAGSQGEQPELARTLPLAEPEGPAGVLTAIPLWRLQRRVGVLGVPCTAQAQDALATARSLEPVLATLAALVMADADVEAPAMHPGQPELIRSALAGAGSFVWEWNIDSDELGDIDEGLKQLGYESGTENNTQERWNSLIHPDDLDANHEAYLAHARGETEAYEHTYRVKARDGSWRWYVERGRIVERHADGRPRRMTGTQTDITARREMETAVAQATERLERIARHIPGVLYKFVMRPDGRTGFDYASDRIHEVFGVGPDTATGRFANVFGLVEPDDRQRVAETVMQSARTLTEWQQEFRVRRADGEVRWFSASSTPLRESDGSTVWYGYMHDVTGQHELAQAQQQAVVAAAANRAKTEFLSRMSHELRTPLNAVLGFTQLMEIDRAEPPTEGQARRLKLIREAGDHLLRMISDLLDLTRIEEGGMSLTMEAVPVRALLAHAIGLLQPAADAAQVVVGVLPGPELSVMADRTRLQQVLMNLLSNAIKYNRLGGRVEAEVASLPDGLVALHVRDTGLGIEQDILPRLFEPFFRGAQAQGKIEGTGIGLSLTRSLVQLMNGRIDVSSEPGLGSVFSVILPGATPPGTRPDEDTP